MAQLYTPIFSKKYLDTKTRNLHLSQFPDLAHKLELIQKWQNGIKNGKILKQKEEELQSEFLNTFFGEVLEYVYSPDAPKWNLSKEHKSDTDSTKADGALGYFWMFGKDRKADVRAVIELKDARADLDKPQNRLNDKRSPVEQAFSYVPKAGGNCRWVIVSNFLEIRFYHHTDQSRYERFDVMQLHDEKELLRFLFLLHKDRLILEHGESGTEQLYRERQTEEQKITKDFYKDYKKSRLDLFRHLHTQNPEIPELTIFQKTQKLLDRVVFVCFCEDLAIIPPYTFRGLLKTVKDDKFNRQDTKIYERVKGLFEAIDKGFPDAGINKFNGGLFAPDELLDNLKIKDSTLEHIIALEQYDFASDLNVNILGHIFEQSISDIEETKAEISGLKFDSKKGKRKKEGVFYTPEYITRYMVKEAVGGWLLDRQQEIGFAKLPELTENDYAKIRFEGKKLVTTKAVEKHIKAWDAYRETLRNIKVLDPACGSGAFLNQVFDYLFQEGQRVNKELARLRGGQFEAFDLDKHILTSNIFGVDLNEESVEITKLSLWLKTANKSKELTTLDANIKCGNSLISDPDVAGDKAFNWTHEFPEVFAANGFDVVVGNPPYVRQEMLGEIKPYLAKAFTVFNGTADLYTYFFELGLRNLNEKGKLAYIAPNKFIKSNYGVKLREYLRKFTMEQIIDFGELPVFAEAATFPAIFIIAKKKTIYKETVFSYIKKLDFTSLTEAVAENHFFLSSDAFDEETWSLSTGNESSIFEKMRMIGIPLGKYTNGSIRRGILTGFNEAYIIDQNTRNELINKDIKSNEIIKPLLDGNDIRKYRIEFKNKFIILSKVGVEIDRYPAIFEHLKRYQNQLEKRLDKGNYWWELRSCSYYQDFETPKICYPDIALESRFTIDYDQFYPNATLFIIPKDDKYLLALLNSKLIWFFLKKICPVIGDENKRGRLRLKTVYLEQLPIVEIPLEDQNPFIEKADLMLLKMKELQELTNNFLKLLKTDLGIVKPNQKLEKWYDLSWENFAKELTKLKVKLTLPQKSEWLSYFETQQKLTADIQNQLKQTDQEIDQMVYQLYGLAEEETKIIEGRI